MTTKHNHQGTRTTNKGALTKFQRVASKAQKSAVRKLARQAPKKIDFDKLARHPLYQRLEKVLLAEEIKNQFAEYGFDSALEIAAFKTITQLEEQTKARGGQVPQNPVVLLERARRAVRKLVAQVRNMIATHDPVNMALRHSSRSISPTMEQSFRETGALRYVRPESIQSDQSFAAYLKDIYDLANTEITVPEGPFQLDKRRPDLKDVVLSDDNLKKEITTLELVNEVLSAQLESHNVDLEVTKTLFYPSALPFHAEHDEMREALMQMGDLNLNELARRTTPNYFAIDESTFTLVPNSADALGLLGDNQVGTNIWGNEKRLLSTGVTQGSVLTTRDLYGYPTADEGADQTNRHALGLVSNFCARSELSFDAFCQMYRQYGVNDDLGTSVKSMEYGAHFFTWDGDLFLVPRSDGEFQMFGEQDGYAPYSVLRSMHFLIRLHHRTAIPFHTLDWLLQVPGTAAADPNVGGEDTARRELLEQGFDVLAHYLYYQQNFNLEADEFVALLWRINPYYRVDSGEESQMRQLFGDDAALVRQSTLAGDLARLSLDTSELGDVLRRGFQVTSTEWQAMVARIDLAGKTMLNEATLARLYRLVRVMRLLEWDIEQGLALVDLCENGLSSDLVKEIPTNARPMTVLSALDRLVHLSRWMKAANLSVSALTAILTPSASIQNKLQSTEQARTWLRGLQQVLVTPRVKEADLFAFRTWSTGSPANSHVIDPATWMSALQEKGVLDAYGMLAPKSRAELENAITDILQSELGQMPNESIAPLTDCLLRAGEGQRDALAGQIVQLQPGSVVDVVGPMLLWMSQYANAPLSTQFVVQTLLAWDYPNASEALGALPQLELCHDLRRYLGAIQTLGLGAIDVALVAEAPEVLRENLGGTSARLLGQLFYLNRFKALQNNIANADAWASYLVLANSEPTPTDALRGQLNAMLALFLDCPQTDIESWLGAGVAKTVDALDTLTRRVALAKTTYQSASELQAVLAVNVPQSDPGVATNAARVAAVGALHRYDGGLRVSAFRNAIAERKRDALVALYMAKVVAPDANLSGRVKDTETLYEYLLLDVNVSSAVPTSRLVEACSSVQVFVNRAIAGLEPSANIADREALKREWEISSHYRVWEANRKLERYPGNYIEPELRYEKSPLFQSLEGALGSGEINEETIETAVYQYMEGLQRIAELTVCGFSKEELPGNRLTFHFVARSNWEKAQYYYRAVVIDLTDDRLKQPDAWRKALAWEPWRQIQISPTNPVISDMAVCRAWNRLFFFWMELEESMDNEGAKFYTLRPQYLRTRLNGLSGDVLSPRSTLTAAQTQFATVPTVETRHPCFDGDSIKMEYRIPGNTPKIYGLSVNSKVAEIVAVTSNSFDVSTQVVAGFQGIASLDGTVTAGESAYVFSPTPATIKAATTFQTEHISLFSGCSNYTTWSVSLKNALQLQVKYNLQGGIGELEFTLDANTLQGVCTANGSNLSMNGIELYFYATNKLIPVIEVHGPNGQTQSMRLESLIVPVAENFNADLQAQFAIPLPKQTTKFTLPTTWWPDPKNVPLSVRVEFYFEHTPSRLVFPTGGSYSQSDAKECICAHASCNATLAFVQETSLPHALSFYETGDLGSEAYLYFSNAADFSPTDSYVSLLYSEAIATLARSLPVAEGRTLLDELFVIDNQGLSEGNVNDFCKKLYAKLKTSSTNGCTPETELAFDGAFGLYAWEVFYHIPSLVASRYVEQGNYDAAARWFQAIYDPSRAPSWNVLPLRQCVDQSSAAPSEGIADPDALAMDNPAFYQQATIRQVLEATLAAGDNAYRQETQESLQQAKLLYVSGKRLFGAELGDELETSTASDWKNPTLGSVKLTDFHPPYNQDLRDFYATFEERLYNLRHWLSIDGEPLNIPLLAAPIDPRALQLVGQSRGAAPVKTEAASSPSPYPFEVILAKAQGYVKNLQSMSTRLLDALEKKDDRELAMIVQAEALSGLETQIELQELKLEEALKAKEIADAQLEEATAETEHEEQRKYLTVDNVKLAVEKTRLAWKNGALNTKRLTLEVSTMASALIPKIAGLAFGGMAPQESFLGNLLGVIHEKQDLQSEKEDVAEEEVSYKEQFENEYNALKAARKMAELERAVERADLLVQQEERALEVLKKQRESGENVMHFMSNRLTNTEFYGWYVGQLASLYQASYDATLSMCRMAERALGEQTPITATFVRANWNGNYMGLLAADSLALDLQRMDLAFTQYMIEADDQTNTYSAGLDDTRTIDNQHTVLEALLEYGEAEFELTEEMFDEFGPNEVDRRIQYVRVQFPDLQRVGKLPHAKLTQVSNRRYPGRDRDPSKAVSNVLVMQTLLLNGAETDTRTQGRSGRRLGVFQGTGTHSTWRLSIPGVVHALAQKRGTNAHHVMLKKLVREIVLEIGYTARHR